MIVWHWEPQAELQPSMIWDEEYFLHRSLSKPNGERNIPCPRLLRFQSTKHLEGTPGRHDAPVIWQLRGGTHNFGGSY